MTYFAIFETSNKRKKEVCTFKNSILIYDKRPIIQFLFTLVIR